jgi:hypothetical protein
VIDGDVPLIAGTVVDDEDIGASGMGVFTRLSLVDDVGVCNTVGSSVSRAEDADLAGGRVGVRNPDEDGSVDTVPARLELLLGKTEDRPVMGVSPPSPCFK